MILLRNFCKSIPIKNTFKNSFLYQNVKYNENISNKFMPSNSNRSFSSTIKPQPQHRQQQQTKDYTLIYKWLSIGTLVLGVPYLYYYKNKSHLRSKTPNEIIVDDKIKSSNVINHKDSDDELRMKPIENLPEIVPYLIIGGGPSGFSAARTIRGNDPTARVLIVTEENHFPYTRTPLTKELWFSGLDNSQLSFKQYNGKERSIYFENEEFYLPLSELMNETSNHGGISVLKQHKIIELNTELNEVKLDNGQKIKYNKCIITTGSKPKNFPCFQQAIDNDETNKIPEKIILYRYPENYQHINRLLPKLKSLTLIGNGFVSSELAFSLIERSKKLKSNVKINHIFEENGVLDDILPDYLSEWCTDRIKDENVNVITNVKIDSVQLNDKNSDELILKLSNGQTINTELCIIDNGLEPNVDLANSAKFEIDTINGGIVANSELQLQSNIWAAGDVVSFYDEKYRLRRRNYHHDNAIYTGRLAGDNASISNYNNKKQKKYSHYSRFWSDLGSEIGFEAIGMIDSKKYSTFAMFAKTTDDDNEKNDQYKYERGVLFYLNDDKTIVGIILWNIFDVENMHIARRILSNGMKNKDLNDVARLFSLYPSSSSKIEDFNDNNNNNNNGKMNEQQQNSNKKID